MFISDITEQRARKVARDLREHEGFLEQGSYCLGLQWCVEASHVCQKPQHVQHKVGTWGKGTIVGNNVYCQFIQFFKKVKTTLTSDHVSLPLTPPSLCPSSQGDPRLASLTAGSFSSR